MTLAPSAAAPPTIESLAAVAAVAATLSACLVRLLRPVLVRYALARPNARSSHTVPIPQGGGVAVLGAAFVAALGALVLFDMPAGPELAILAAATAVLAVLGAVDDIRPLSPALRALFQLGCVSAVVAGSGHGRVLPEAIPTAFETAILVLAGLWWVNLVNFMDGIDWMTVCDFVPTGAALCLFGAAGILPGPAALVAACLLGALLGFAPANRPPARLFLGDVGSLPIGLLSGWLLLRLAGSENVGSLAAAFLLPLYYLADATLTLGQRTLRGERVWEAHRCHFYQQAVDRGVAVLTVDRWVLALNIALALLAATALHWPSLPVQVATLSVGIGLTAWTLRRFAGTSGAERDR